MNMFENMQKHTILMEYRNILKASYTFMMSCE